MTVSLNMTNDYIAVLQIDRPEVRNALDWTSIELFREQIEHAHSLPDLRALILTGSKDAFIAGGDLRALHSHPTLEDGQRLSIKMSTALDRLEALPCPTIAAINGPARGGGAEIALACDLRVMARNSDLGFVQINLALLPGWGASQRLLRLVGYSRALEWLIRGRILTAEEVFAIGLANEIAPETEALEVALSLAQEISRKSQNAVKAIKRILRAGLYANLEIAAALERAEFPALWAGEEHLLAVENFLKRSK